MRRISQWAADRKLTIFFMSIVIAFLGLVSAYNAHSYPMRFEDEGTYISQAWAMQYRGQLAHYTYWYDHPPVGWAQLAGWTALTQAYDRYDSSIIAGREFIIVLRIVSMALLYVLARRIGINGIWAGVAVVLYGLSPLSLTFGRFVLLDNIALPWLLGAFILALSPRRNIASVAGSAICMAIAILSKETLFLLLPALLYALWINSDKRNRRFSFIVFSTILTMIGSFYVVYAALKNELFEGVGHVSLIGAIKWQLFSREGSGSIFDPDSGAHGLMNMWLNIDPWLLGLGVVLLPIGLVDKKIRVIAIALLIQVVMLLRTGYLPFPYIIAMLPFAALVIASAGNTLTHKLNQAGKESLGLQVRASVLSLAVLAFVFIVMPAWSTKIAAYAAIDADKSARQAVAWLNANVDRQERLVVDSGLWVDLVKQGFTEPEAVWLYKTETDPKVAGELGGWEGIDYVAVTAPTLDPRNQRHFPTLFKAQDHSTVAATFGDGDTKIVILKVDPSHAETAAR